MANRRPALKQESMGNHLFTDRPKCYLVKTVLNGYTSEIDSKSRLSKLQMEDVILHLPTVLPEANFTDEFILFSSERSDGFTSNGLVGFV